MSPASKSKSRDKPAPKEGKEQSKISTKSSTMRSNCNHSPSAASHSLVLGTFQAVDMSSSSFSPPKANGQFRTIDDPDDHSTSSQGTTAEYDSSSNNSFSGESEDQKEKPTLSPPQPETILSCDNDKRDKNRLKNERKHQRQKEKRAQELHERCTAFLTSRKLEALSHQLVAMGFPADRATMAVIINKGRMEECVSWLLHERDNNKHQVSVNLDDKSCVSIDITDELAGITKMVVKYKCSRQDVERAIVACEGDLLKAEENLKVQKQAAAVVPKSESLDSMKLNDKQVIPNDSPALITNPTKGATGIVISEPPRHEGRYSNLSKSALKPTDWSRNQAAPNDKRSTISAPMPLPSAAHPSKREAAAPKESFVFMQRPKDIPTVANSIVGNKHTVTGTNNGSLQPCHPQNNLQHMPLAPMDISASARWSRHLWRASGANLSPLTLSSSPGLFTGWGSSASSESSSQNGWDTRGSTPNRDYTSIDWSLDLTPLRPLRKIDAMSGTWSTMFMGGNAARMPPTSASLINGGGGGGICFPEAGGLLAGPSDSGRSLEWSSPFEGWDLFGAPRKYVTSPSMY